MDHHPNLDPSIVNCVNSHIKDGVINLDKAISDTIVTFTTKSGSTYLLKKVDQDNYLLQGGNNNLKFVVPTPVLFNGSTFGGSMLLFKSLGIGMYAEFIFNRKTYTTTAIETIKCTPYQENIIRKN